MLLVWLIRETIWESLPLSDIMPGYTASHGVCKKKTNFCAKFYGKTSLNGEIPVNKYQNNINHNWWT